MTIFELLAKKEPTEPKPDAPKAADWQEHVKKQKAVMSGDKPKKAPAKPKAVKKPKKSPLEGTDFASIASAFSPKKGKKEEPKKKDVWKEAKDTQPHPFDYDDMSLGLGKFDYHGKAKHLYEKAAAAGSDDAKIHLENAIHYKKAKDIAEAENKANLEQRKPKDEEEDVDGGWAEAAAGPGPAALKQQPHKFDYAQVPPHPSGDEVPEDEMEAHYDEYNAATPYEKAKMWAKAGGPHEEYHWANAKHFAGAGVNSPAPQDEHAWINDLPNPKDYYKQKPTIYPSFKPYESLDPIGKVKAWGYAHGNPLGGDKDKDYADHIENLKHLSENPPKTPGGMPHPQHKNKYDYAPPNSSVADMDSYQNSSPAAKMLIHANWAKQHANSFPTGTKAQIDAKNYYLRTAKEHAENSKWQEEKGSAPKMPKGSHQELVPESKAQAAAKHPHLPHPQWASSYEKDIKNTKSTDVPSMAQSAEAHAALSSGDAKKQHWANAIAAWKKDHGASQSAPKIFPQESAPHPDWYINVGHAPPSFTGADSEWNKLPASERFKEWAVHFHTKWHGTENDMFSGQMAENAKAAKKWEVANGVKPKKKGAFEVQPDDLPHPWHYGYPPPALEGSVSSEAWESMPDDKKMKLWADNTPDHDPHDKTGTGYSQSSHQENYLVAKKLHEKHVDDKKWEKINKKYGHAPGDVLVSSTGNGYREAPQGVDQKFWEKQPLSARAEYMAEFLQYSPKLEDTITAMKAATKQKENHLKNAEAARAWEEANGKQPKAPPIKDQADALPFPEHAKMLYHSRPIAAHVSPAQWSKMSLKEKALEYAKWAAMNIGSDSSAQSDPARLARLHDELKQHLANAGMLQHDTGHHDDSTQEMFPGEAVGEASTYHAQHPQHPHFPQPFMAKPMTAEKWHALTDKQKKTYHELLGQLGQHAGVQNQIDLYDQNSATHMPHYSGNGGVKSYHAKDNPKHPHYLPPTTSMTWDDWNDQSDEEKAQAWEESGHKHNLWDAHTKGNTLPEGFHPDKNDSFAAKNPSHPHFLQPKGSKLPGVLYYELPDKQKAKIWKDSPDEDVNPDADKQPIFGNKLLGNSKTFASMNENHPLHDAPDWYDQGQHEWETLSDSEKQDKIDNYTPPEEDEENYGEDDGGYDGEDDNWSAGVPYSPNGQDPGYDESAEPTGVLGGRIHKQITDYIQNNPHHDPQFGSLNGDRVVRNLDRGDSQPEDLWRAWKNNNNATGAYMAKYLVHRATHVREYDNPKRAKELDEEFKAQNARGTGKDSPKIDTLHEWAKRNPTLISDMIRHKRALNHLIINGGTGHNIKEINGEPYIALHRGISSQIMHKEHTLVSSDDTGDWSGTHHYMWVPLKDVWYSYDCGPRDCHTHTSHGSEHEYIIANTGTRYKAEPEDIKTNALGRDNGVLHETPNDPKSWAKTKSVHPAMHPKSDDAKIAASIDPGSPVKILISAAGHANAGEATLNRLAEVSRPEQWREWLGKVKNPPEGWTDRLFQKLDKTMEIRKSKDEDLESLAGAGEGIIEMVAKRTPDKTTEALKRFKDIVERHAKPGDAATYFGQALYSATANLEPEAKAKIREPFMPWIEQQISDPGSRIGGGHVDSLVREVLQSAKGDELQKYTNMLINGDPTEYDVRSLMSNDGLSREDAVRVGEAYKQQQKAINPEWKPHYGLLIWMPASDLDVANLIGSERDSNTGESVDNYDLGRILENNKHLTAEQAFKIAKKAGFGSTYAQNAWTNKDRMAKPEYATSMVKDLIQSAEQTYDHGAGDPSEIQGLMTNLRYAVGNMSPESKKATVGMVLGLSNKGDPYKAERLYTEYGQTKGVTPDDIAAIWPEGGDAHLHDRMLDAMNQVKDGKTPQDIQKGVERMGALKDELQELMAQNKTKYGEKEYPVYATMYYALGKLADERSTKIRAEEDAKVTAAKWPTAAKKYGHAPEGMNAEVFDGFPLEAKAKAWAAHYHKTGQTAAAKQADKDSYAMLNDTYKDDAGEPAPKEGQDEDEYMGYGEMPPAYKTNPGFGWAEYNARQRAKAWADYYSDIGESEKAHEAREAAKLFAKDKKPEKYHKYDAPAQEDAQERAWKKLEEQGHIIKLLPKEYRKMIEEWITLMKTSVELDLSKTDALAFTLNSLAGDNKLVQVQLPVIDDQIGFLAHAAAAFKAARFLAQAKHPIGIEDMQRLVWEADGDYSAAALLAYGLKVDKQNREALDAIESMMPSEVQKTEAEDIKMVVPRFPSTGQEVCDSINDAITIGKLNEIVLGKGKHNSGSLVATDVAGGKQWLLKPNAGGVSGAAGVAEEPASQATREACFYRAADVFGLHYWIPRAECVLMGTTEYAAVELLDSKWLNLGRVLHDDPNEGERIFNTHVVSGLVHRWAVLDYVLGNPDRHSSNIMVLGNNVQLLDSGSAFAGNSFDPGHDKKSFVPYYLRAKAKRWSKMSPEERLFSMPVPSMGVDNSLRAWVDKLNENVLAAILVEHGVNPQPTLARLARVRALPGIGFSLGVNKLWMGTL